MSLSKKGTFTNDTKLSTANKATALNPNAAEFVPFSLRSPSSGSTSTGQAATKFSSTGTFGKAVLDRTESSASNNSDEEAHQYWRHQLPDDITPDFKVMGEVESQGLGNLSLAGLSLHDDGEATQFPASTGSGYLLNESHINSNNFSEKLRASAPPFGDDLSSASFLHMSPKPWDKQIVNSNQLISNGQEGSPYDGFSRQGFMNDMFSEHAVVDDTDINPAEFLASQFPGFSAQSLAEVYFANGCDLNLTIEMLTQLEVCLIYLFIKINKYQFHYCELRCVMVCICFGCSFKLMVVLMRILTQRLCQLLIFVQWTSLHLHQQMVSIVIQSMEMMISSKVAILIDLLTRTTCFFSSLAHPFHLEVQ